MRLSPRQRQHKLLGQVRAYGAVLDQHAVAILPTDQAHARKQARRIATVRICKRGARADRAGGRIDLVVNEIQSSGVRIAVLVDEPDIDTRGIIGSVRVVPRLGKTQVGLLIGVEVHIDRIVGDERREEARARHEIPRGDDGARHMTVDRRAYLGELPIETRLVQGRIDRTQCSLRGGFGSDQALVFLARDGVRADEPLGAGVIGLGKLEVRHAAAALRDQAIDFGLEWTRIDLEQQLPLFDARAVREGDAIDIAADARTNLDRIHGLQAPGEFLPFAQRLVNHFGDRHLSQRRSWRPAGRLCP